MISEKKNKTPPTTAVGKPSCEQPRVWCYNAPSHSRLERYELTLCPEMTLSSRYTVSDLISRVNSPGNSEKAKGVAEAWLAGESSSFRARVELLLGVRSPGAFLFPLKPGTLC